MAKIVLFADNVNIALTVRTQLQAYGHEVTTCLREEQVLQKCKVDTRIVIGFLDKQNLGFERVVERLRARGQEVGVIIFQPIATCAQIVSTLSKGVDAFVDKRCSNQEIAARVQAMLRRPPRSACLALSFGPLVIDEDHRAVHVLGSELELRRKEYLLLHALVQARGRVISRSQLSDLGNFDGSSDYAALNTQISNLRSALAKVGVGDLLETVHGVGYRLKETL